ncbi:MAG: hypothetical protein OXF06_06840 [Bacteroidetes bacterium]|nr:hypothetical protein [Bacteroidota bacterium]
MPVPPVLVTWGVEADSNRGGTPFIIYVELSRSLGTEVIIPVTVNQITDNNNDWYAPTSRQVTIQVRLKSGTYEIITVGDTYPEKDEQLWVQLGQLPEPLVFDNSASI